MFSLLSELIFPPKRAPPPRIDESLLVEAQNDVGERILLEIVPPPHSYARDDVSGVRRPVYDERTFYR